MSGSSKPRPSIDEDGGLGRCLWLALRSLLAMLLAFLVVWLVNQAGGSLADWTGSPAGASARLGWDLAWVMLAGVAATWVVVKLAPGWPRAHAAAFFMLMLAMDIVAVLQLGDGWPRWFSAGILLTLPLQVGFGAWLALRSKRAGA